MIVKGIKTPSSVDAMVNYGRVYNFYNPLNFSETKINQNSIVLDDIPLRTKEKVEQLCVPIADNIKRVAVYLMASFLPPKEWVPGAYFIPIIDESWLLFRLYESEEDQDQFILIGETKNSKHEHIKYEYWGSLDEPFVNPNPIFFEDEPRIMGNAFNLGIIGIAERVSDIWNIKQCINNHFPVTFFFDTYTYETCNTHRFYLGAIEEKKKIEIGDYCGIMPPEARHYRGNIQYSQQFFRNENSQPLFPSLSYSHKELLENLNPLFDPK